MKTFYIILANSLAASIVNNFVWFAVTFWVFLETQSVIATSVMAGVFTTIVALSGFFLGSLVDRFPKKNVMLVSSAASLGLYGLSAAVFVVTPAAALSDPASPALWAFIVSALIGAIAGNLRGIAVATLVTIMIPEDGRDKANGLVGTSTGIGFLAASIFSGLAVAYVGMAGMLAIAIVLTGVVMAHLWTVPVPAAPAPQTAKASPAGSPEVPSAGMVGRYSGHDPGHRAGARPVRTDPVPHLQQLPGRRLHVADGRLRPAAGLGADLGHPCGAC